jgi:hypothetical protein
MMDQANRQEKPQKQYIFDNGIVGLGPGFIRADLWKLVQNGSMC